MVETDWRPDPARRSANADPIGLWKWSRPHHPSGERAAQGAASLGQVDGRLLVRRGPVIRRQFGIEVVLGDLVVEEESVAQGEQLCLGHLLDLVGGIAGFDLGTERPALDGLGQDGGRCPDVLGGRLVGGVELPVVVASPREGLQFLVGEVADQFLETGIGTEEVLPDVRPGLGGVLLELAVHRRVHLVQQHPFHVLGQQVVPGAAPDHLDHVPARPPEEGLELLDHLAVAPHRTVESLEVAVDHEDQVVEVLPPGHSEGADGLGFVEFPVTHEAPHPAVLGAGDTTGVEVAAHVGLGDGVERAETHRHRGVLPELGHQPGMRIGGEPVAPHLEPEVVQLLLREAALHEGPGVDARRGMTLEIDLIPGMAIVLSPEEVVEPHLVQGGGAGVGREVAADGLRADVGPDHHDRGIPADEGPDAPFEVFVAGELRLLVGGDGVDVGGGDRGREVHLLLARPLEDSHEQVAGPGPPVDIDDVVERVQPFRRLHGIGVGKLMAHSVEQHLPMLALPGPGGKDSTVRDRSRRLVRAGCRAAPSGRAVRPRRDGRARPCTNWPGATGMLSR